MHRNSAHALKVFLKFAAGFWCFLFGLLFWNKQSLWSFAAKRTWIFFFFSIHPELFYPFGLSAACAVIPFIGEHQFNSQQQQILQQIPQWCLVLSVVLLNVSDDTKVWAVQKSAILLTLEQLNHSITREKSRSVAAQPCSARATLKINNKKLDKNKATTKIHKPLHSSTRSILCRILSSSTDTKTIKISWLVNSSAFRGVKRKLPRAESVPLRVMDSTEGSAFCPEIFSEVFPERAVRSAHTPSFRVQTLPPWIKLCPGGPSAPPASFFLIFPPPQHCNTAVHCHSLGLEMVQGSVLSAEEDKWIEWWNISQTGWRNPSFSWWCSQVYSESWILWFPISESPAWIFLEFRSQTHSLFIFTMAQLKNGHVNFILDRMKATKSKNHWIFITPVEIIPFFFFFPNGLLGE